MTICLILIFFLTLVYVFLFLFYILGWMTLKEYHVTERKPTTKISIIIPARNEESNIANVLANLLEQNFPPELFEIIVIDDFSHDRTPEIVTSFQTKNIRLLHLKDYLKPDEIIQSYKKKALEIGIRHSIGELIITTDADCRMNINWLQTMVSFYEEKRCHMVVAPVLIDHDKNFFQKFQALDLVGLIGITGATLQLNFPTMCNGANLAFRKQSFYEVNGYEGISEKTSGDDMLLMHKMAKRWKRGVLFLKHNDAVVSTQAQRSILSFLKQRIRWTSKSEAYKGVQIILNLLAVLLFNFSILVSFAISFFSPDFLLLFLIQFVTKVIMDFAFLSQATNFFNRKNLMWIFLPAEILHVIYIVTVGIAGNFLPVKWKGRLVK